MRVRQMIEFQCMVINKYLNNFMNIKDLTKQIPHKWRVQSFSKNKPSASCVAYIDARDVMNLLDEVVGANNWQDKYEFIGDKLIAGIGIYNSEIGQWIWKFDTGTTGNIEEEKSLFSDAFKRAAVKWGIGRFLYDLDIQYVKTNEIKTSSNWPYPVTDNGQRIWDLTKHLNSIKK